MTPRTCIRRYLVILVCGVSLSLASPCVLSQESAVPTAAAAQETAPQANPTQETPAEETPTPLAPPENPTGEPVAQPKKSGSRPDLVIARIGDFNITQREFERDVMLRWSMQGPGSKSMPPTPEFRNQVLREVVDARVLRVLARNSGMEATEEEVREEYEAGRRQMRTEEAFRGYLDKMGITVEELMAQIRERIIVDKYTERETANLVIPDEEVAAAYEKIKESGQARRNAPTADLSQILIIPETTDEIGWEQARARIEAARQRIVDGESFAEVARDVSQDPLSARRGGEYLEAVPGVVGPELSDKMMNLPIGELSEPFRSTVGWHIIQVKARYEPGEITYEQFAPVIRERMLNERRKREIARKIAEARKIIRIEIMPGSEN